MRQKSARSGFEKHRVFGGFSLAPLLQDNIHIALVITITGHKVDQSAIAQSGSFKGSLSRFWIPLLDERFLLSSHCGTRWLSSLLILNLKATDCTAQRAGRFFCEMESSDFMKKYSIIVPSHPMGLSKGFASFSGSQAEIPAAKFDTPRSESHSGNKTHRCSSRQKRHAQTRVWQGLA